MTPIINHVIVIPGLGNNVKKHEWAMKEWKKFGIIPHVFDTKWKTEENGFQPKLDQALKLVDSLTNKNTRISIIGNSAGSSFALNIFGERKGTNKRPRDKTSSFIKSVRFFWKDFSCLSLPLLPGSTYQQK